MERRLNIHDAKTQFSRFLNELTEGDTIILCRRNEPIAEIRPLPSKPKEMRPLGLGRGASETSEGFFDPLPEELLELFEGQD